MLYGVKKWAVLCEDLSFCCLKYNKIEGTFSFGVVRMVLEVGLCVGRVNKRPIGGPYAFFDVSEVQKGTRGVPEHPRHPVKVFVDQFSGVTKRFCLPSQLFPLFRLNFRLKKISEQKFVSKNFRGFAALKHRPKNFSRLHRIILFWKTARGKGSQL